MATDDDDDLLTGPVPVPEAEPSASERVRAKAFGELVDKAVAGRTPPPAMSADDRALLEVATVIRAASGNVELPVAKRQAIVEDALRQAIGGASKTASGVVPISRARRRWMPWAISGVSTAVAVAAVLLLWLRRPEPAPPQPVAEAPTLWKSRPADPLIGPISRDRVGDAGTRIDRIFDNRLDGYRARQLAGSGLGRGGKP